MAITWTDVVLIAPELSGTALPSAARTEILSEAELGVSTDADSWPTTAKRRVATMYLAAHLATVMGIQVGGSASGPLTGVKVGDVSKTFAGPIKGANPALDATKYGREFQRLVSANFYCRLPAV